MTKIQLGSEYIDVEDGVLSTIEDGHVRIHQGDMFEVSYYWTTVANAGTVMLSGVIPSNFEPHTEFAVNHGGNCKFEIIEGGTITGGTAVVAYNKNRNADVLSIGTIAYHSGTLTGGTVIFTSFQPGGEKTFATGNGTRAESEWIHAEGKTTTWRVTNVSGGDIGISMAAQFYNGEDHMI